MKSVFLITGNSGTGKSKILSELRQAAGGRLYIFDGLLDDGQSFHLPNPHECDIIALDHLAGTPNKRAICEQAYAWCLQNNKMLCMTSLRREIAESYFAFPEAVVEMQIRKEGEKRMLHFSSGEHSSVHERESFMAMAQVMLAKAKAEAATTGELA